MSISVVAQTGNYNIIPLPLKLKAQPGQFVFNAETRFIIPSNDTDIYNAAFSLLERFLLSSNLNIRIFEASQIDPKNLDNTIFFKINPLVENKEGYNLKIRKNRIDVEAGSAAGFFYAMQTLRQMLPPEIEKNKTSPDVVWAVSCVDIEDAPRYPYRGLLLDVCRHFSDVTAVKRYIDQLAFHKINTFHWHLTDDQGWRIHIDKYPKLSEISAWRDRTLIGPYVATERKYKQERYGGFYTKEQVKEVVEHAKKRFVTVIPEIEMPGHAVAALAAYPELSCSGGPFEVEGLWGVFNDVYCPKETTFEFLENVLSEVIDMFPGQYIHIGGDECPKVRWERCHHCQTKIKELGLKDEHGLQSYFVTRIEKFVNTKGKRIIGWDEILEGGLAPDATVMSWRRTEGGIAAAKQGHDVIMTPTAFCYFDFYQSENKEAEPLAIGGYLPLEKVYDFDPTPEALTSAQAKHILGGQANLWTEYIPSEMHAQYMLFPRLAALSEAVWTPKNNKNYADFKSRLLGILKHYDTMKLTYSKSNLNMEQPTQ